MTSIVSLVSTNLNGSERKEMEGYRDTGFQLEILLYDWLL